jgi:hypothetical protein
LTKDVADAAAGVRPRLRRFAQVFAVIFAIAVAIAGAAWFRAERASRDSSAIADALRAELVAQRGEVETGMRALKGEISKLDEKVEEELAQVLRRAEASVVMLALQDERGNVRFVGTGWVAAPRTIATNAHVADALRTDGGVSTQQARTDKRLKPIARRVTSDGVQDIPLTQIAPHPGFAQWSRILSDPSTRLRPGVSAEETAGASGIIATNEVLIAPYDAAVLRTESDCGPPLPMASDDTIRKLKPGDEIGYVGYPSENVFDPRSSPPALLTGRIVRLTDYFYNPVSDEVALLVHHNLPTVGGASGSPILSRAGEVVAINSAGSFVGAVSANDPSRPKRIPIGFNYGQTATFVRECMDDSAPQALVARNPNWHAKLQQFSLPPSAAMEAFADGILRALKQRGELPAEARVERQFDREISIGRGRDAGASVDIDLDARSTLLVQACADDRSDLDLEISEDQTGKVVASDKGDGAMALAALKAPGAAKYSVRVYSEAPVLASPRVTLRVSKLTG